MYVGPGYADHRAIHESTSYFAQTQVLPQRLANIHFS